MPRYVRSLIAVVAGQLCSARLAAADSSAPGASSSWIAGSITFLTLGLVVWVALVWHARRAIFHWLTDLAVEKTRHIGSARLRRLGLQKYVRVLRLATRILSFALTFLGLFLWATLVLALFPHTHSLAQAIELQLWNRVAALGRAGVLALPDLCIVGAIFFAARIAAEFLNHYFRAIAEGELKSTVFDEVTGETTRRLLGLGIWIFAVIIAFPYLPGSDSAAFRGITALMGLMISLGSASLVGQFASGLILIYGRTVRQGDYVQTDKAEGVIEQVGLFSCMVRTPRDEIVTIPHATIAAGLKNFSRARVGVRCAAVVTIGYDAPWRTVRDLLLAAAAGTAGVRPNPAPQVRQAGLEDFYVRYELLFTPENPAEQVWILSRLHEAIQDRFDRAGIQIMSPHYLSDPAAPKLPSRSAADPGA